MTVLQNGELVLYGFVGDSFWGEGFTATEVLQALIEVGRDADITVRINSGGGYTDDGVAIYNALIAHKGKVTTVVDAVAASAASIIAMAGEDRVMRKGALMMIHDPAMVTWGTAADHEKSKALLDKLAAQMASIYADATGEDEEDIRSDMQEELWLNGEEAVERGFATSVEEKKARAVAAFDYRKYEHAPERLVALAAKKSWAFDKASKPAATSAASTRQTEEDDTMTDKKPGTPGADDQTAAFTAARSEAASEAKARIKAIVTNAEAQGREDLADHLAYETDMTAEAAVAMLAKAPKATASAADEEGEPDETGADPTAFERQRLTARGQAAPGGAPKKAEADINLRDIYASRRQKS